MELYFDRWFGLSLFFLLYVLPYYVTQRLNFLFYAICTGKILMKDPNFFNVSFRDTLKETLNSFIGIPSKHLKSLFFLLIFTPE